MQVKQAVYNARGLAEEVIYLKDVALAPPDENQVRVQMLAAAINPSDLHAVEGVYNRAFSRTIWNYGLAHWTIDPDKKFDVSQPPGPLGNDGVGIVIGAGIRAQHLVGKRVVLLPGSGGTWKEQVQVPAHLVLPLPDEIPTDQAAMFFVNPVTAYSIIRRVFNVMPGEFLIQTAAASALGQMVVRLGRHLGFKTINLIRSDSAGQMEKLNQLGADHVIVADQEAPIEAIAEITKGRGARYAIDCVGGDLTASLMRCLGVGGHMVLYGTLAQPSFTLTTRDLMTPCARVEGFFLPQWLAAHEPTEIQNIVKSVMELIADGVLVSEVGARYSITQLKEAIVATKKTGRNGKVLLTF